ncbi:MAG: VOC family protein [Desulfarculaceae bacterium]|nr:VOC family protein [Desulfarculaceae bacterium]MCF8073573.1 VOC family protein [Desulfarculaceae bacterium]MCF8103095.1 VOC family protein [Desulfarculaceae bacterium]MCF8115711.1 VOC family protein [Desulfarculaceae bacterium]
MALTLDHVHMRCQDLQATEDFYVNMFGGEVVARLQVRGNTLVRVKVGDMFLALSPKRADEPEPNESGIHWGAYELGFLVEDVDQAFEELSAKGAQFLGPPMEVRAGVKIAFLQAPDGVKIEILHRD